MSADNSLEAAALRLRKAIQRLSTAVDGHLEREALFSDAEAEVQRQTADRSRLATELDSALARGQRLEQTNREVSKRLVGTMETIRFVLDRQK